MSTLKKIWAFIRKWWIWLGAGLVVILLLARRGVVMAGLSKLRRELEAKTKALRDLEYTRDTQVFKEDIAAHQVKVDAGVPAYAKRTGGVTGNLTSIGSDTLNNLMTLWAESF